MATSGYWSISNVKLFLKFMHVYRVSRTLIPETVAELSVASVSSSDDNSSSITLISLISSIVGVDREVTKEW